MHRSIRTLDVVLTALGGKLPGNLPTLPKIQL
jgi:hypothetical protein